MRWRKQGRFLYAHGQADWLHSHTGASFAILDGDGDKVTIYVTGRDRENRSAIGRVSGNLNDLQNTLKIEQTPVYTYGERGTFDENGVSYPWFVRDRDEPRAYLMYYVGWMPSVLTPFINNTGVARYTVDDDQFKRLSRASVLPMTDREPFGTGSCCVLYEKGEYRMWYTSFLRWGDEGEHKHYYVVRHASSVDGICWNRSEGICIDIEDPSEYAIGKPSVFVQGDQYHMWYVYRGDQYRIGYAISSDGLNWKRRDNIVGLEPGPEAWDKDAIAYPHVFAHKDNLYMLYCGNQYGLDGLGLAKMPLDELPTT